MQNQQLLTQPLRAGTKETIPETLTEHFHSSSRQIFLLAGGRPVGIRSPTVTPYSHHTHTTLSMAVEDVGDGMEILFSRFPMNATDGL